MSENGELLTREEVETIIRERGIKPKRGLTYHPESPSYYRDLFFAERGSKEARERLEQHGKEMRVELGKRERRILPGVEYEYRANPSREEGHGGEFAPPLWLIEAFAPGIRPSRCLSRLIPDFDLPAGVDSIRLPRMSTGTRVGPSVDNAGVPGRDVVTKEASSLAVAFAGISDWPIQALEQSSPGAPLDWAIITDLTEDYDFSLEEMIITGSGKGESFEGVLTAGAEISYTEAATAEAMAPFIGRCMAKVGIERKRPPEAVLMATARLMFLATSADKEPRLFFFEDIPGSDFPLASLVGVGVYPDDAIPRTLGASKEEDRIIAARPRDSILLESEQRTLIDTESLSGTMGVRFRLHGYAACVHRYPSGYAFLAGAGMKIPTGF